MKAALPITAEKHQAILDAALALFRQHGSRRISVEEVCRAASVSKMTFYKAFRNKDDLVIAVIDRLIDKYVAEFEALRAENRAFQTRVKAIMAMKQRQIDELGVPFVLDLAKPSGIVAAHLAQLQTRMEMLSFEMFREAQDEGVVRSDLSPELLHVLFNQTASLFDTPDLVRLVPDVRARVSLVHEVFFYGVMTPGAADA